MKHDGSYVYVCMCYFLVVKSQPSDSDLGQEPAREVRTEARGRELISERPNPQKNNRNKRARQINLHDTQVVQ